MCIRDRQPLTSRFEQPERSSNSSSPWARKHAVTRPWWPTTTHGACLKERCTMLLRTAGLGTNK
eukprot:10200096-Alexandrium_andersonii.AAC.1